MMRIGLMEMMMLRILRIDDRGECVYIYAYIGAIRCHILTAVNLHIAAYLPLSHSGERERLECGFAQPYVRLFLNKCL